MPREGNALRLCLIRVEQALCRPDVLCMQLGGDRLKHHVLKANCMGVTRERLQTGKLLWSLASVRGRQRVRVPRFHHQRTSQQRQWVVAWVGGPCSRASLGAEAPTSLGLFLVGEPEVLQNRHIDLKLHRALQDDHRGAAIVNAGRVIGLAMHESIDPSRAVEEARERHANNIHVSTCMTPLAVVGHEVWRHPSGPRIASRTRSAAAAGAAI